MSFKDFISELYNASEKIEMIASEGFKNGEQYLSILSGPSIYDAKLEYLSLDGIIFKTSGTAYDKSINGIKCEKITNFNTLENLKRENIIVKIDLVWFPSSNSRGTYGLINLGNYTIEKRKIVYSEFPEIESHGIKLYLEREKLK